MDSSLSVEMLADIAGLSPAYFGKLFFTTVHVSCNDYLMELRLRKAAELLAETQDTVSTISQAVGINSTNYFYIDFKKKYGCTPVQYRRQIKEEQENGK
ncbi:MAG: helix-turn-helix domain-containing protein [Eisenbergiella sp.]